MWSVDGSTLFTHTLIQMSAAADNAKQPQRWNKRLKQRTSQCEKRFLTILILLLIKPHVNEHYKFNQRYGVQQQHALD